MQNITRLNLMNKNKPKTNFKIYFDGELCNQQHRQSILMTFISCEEKQYSLK